jgi:hypothetical protein
LDSGYCCDWQTEQRAAREALLAHQFGLHFIQSLGADLAAFGKRFRPRERDQSRCLNSTWTTHADVGGDR